LCNEQKARSPELIVINPRPSFMPSNIKVAPHMQQCKEKEVVMRYTSKTTVVIVIFICLSLLAFTWMKGDALCEIKVKLGVLEVAASSAYASVR
jgi:hypothetical protein